MKWIILVTGITAWTLSVEGRDLAVGGIHVYQRAFSGVAARAGVRCRFTPTCSRYAEAVIARDGLLRGGWKAAKRVVRCGPWTPAGTVDLPPLATR